MRIAPISSQSLSLFTFLSKVVAALRVLEIQSALAGGAIQYVPQQEADCKLLKDQLSGALMASAVERELMGSYSETLVGQIRGENLFGFYEGIVHPAAFLADEVVVALDHRIESLSAT